MNIEPIKKSNLSKAINKYVETACNLSTLWNEGDYETKQDIQNMVFPEGIFYNKKNNKCRTPEINPIFVLLNTFSSDYEGQKEREETFYSNFPLSVVPTRIELVSKV